MTRDRATVLHAECNARKAAIQVTSPHPHPAAMAVVSPWVAVGWGCEGCVVPRWGDANYWIAILRHRRARAWH